MSKSNCSGKCNKNCQVKNDAQKRCNGQLPELQSYEVKFVKPTLWSKIKKLFGYD